MCLCVCVCVTLCSVCMYMCVCATLCVCLCACSVYKCVVFADQLTRLLPISFYGLTFVRPGKVG